MALFKELFSSSFGIMSALVILFMIGMGVFFVIMFVKKAYQAPIPESEKNKSKQ